MLNTSNRQPKSKLRLTKRGRAVLATVLAAPLVTGILFGTLSSQVADATDLPGHTFSYLTVGYGDTMWQIAKDLAPAADPRDVISDMKSLNGLSSVSLTPGQRLAIPVKYDN